MLAKQFRGLIPTKFEATAVDPETGEEIKGEINIKLNRLAFKTVTEEGFVDAMKHADTDPHVIGELLAGKTVDGVTTTGVLAWWEMYEDEEKTKMTPIEVDEIISFPYDFVISLSEAVMAKLFPGQRTVVNSPAGSVQTENTNSAAAGSTTATQKSLPEGTTSQEPAVSGE